jgi:transposase-like protein
MIKRTVAPNRSQIISEYLTGEQSFKSLSEKYGIPDRTIQSWVRAYRKQHPEHQKGEQQTDIKALKRQLAQAELKNALLEEMLRLSEEHTGIDFRKKIGTKQS